MGKEDNNNMLGFTLIELSIVLVIISLIVGGVIGGKSLIRSSEIRYLISTVNNYKTSVNTFSLEYDALPGDMRDAQAYWPSCVDEANNTCNGNGDGYILDDSVNKETIRAWQHLSLAGILLGTFNGSATGVVPNVTHPEGIGTGSHYIFYRGKIYNTTANFISLYIDSSLGFDTVNGKEAKSIDKKIDDGKADTGNLLAWIFLGSGCVDAALAPAAGADYILDNDEKNCYLSFALD